MTARNWPETVTIAELAGLLDLSTRALRDYAARGVLVPADERGRFLTLPSLHGYFDRLRRSAEDENSAGRASLATERAQGEAVVRQLNEIKLARVLETQLSYEEIAAAWAHLAGALRSSISAIPDRARTAMPHLTPHDTEVLARLCDDVLSHAAEDAQGMVGTEPELLTSG